MPSENPSPEPPDDPTGTTPRPIAGDRPTIPNLPSVSFPAIFTQTDFAGRLHPLTMVFGLWKGARAVIPIIPLILFGNGRFGWIALALAFAGTVATVMARYFSFRYRIEGNELITEEGIIERKQRHIPLERIQEVRIEQGILHRLLDMVDARIETGGGEGAEASLSVLSRAEAEALRQAVFERAAAMKSGKNHPTVVAGAAGAVDGQHWQPAVAEQEEIVLRRLSVRELAVAGLTSNHLLSALVLTGAIWNFADDILPASIYERAAEFIFRSSRELAMRGLIATLALTLGFVVAVLLIGILFSVAGSVILFYGFRFSLRGENLHRRYGLLTRRASSLPRRRIQVLKIEEKAFRRWFGLATLRADTSGSHRQDKDDNHGRDVLLPIVRRSEVDPLLKVFFPDFDGDQNEWRRVSRLAVRRGTIKGGLVCVFAAALAIALGREWAAVAALCGLPLVYLVNVARHRTLGYSIGERYFRTRSGWLGRSTQVVPINKIQAVEIHQTPFDRRLRLATLRVDTAGQAYTGGGPQISNLPIDEAKEIARRLAHIAARTIWRSQA
jgi:putative membrane protein